MNSYYNKDKNIYLIAQRIKDTIQKIFLICLISGMCFAILYPILKLLPTVFSDLEDIGNPDVIWIPIKRSVLSFVAAYRMMMKSGIMTLVASVSYAVSITFVQLFISAMVGYALARVAFKGANLIFGLVIVTFLVPPQTLLLSQYIHFKNFDFLGIMNFFTNGTVDMINRPITLFLLALLGFGVNQSLFIFMFRQFFKNIPQELEEAAMIDGCGFHKTYFKIMLPNAKPIIATIAILGFVWNYGDTYYTGYFHPEGPYLSYILKTTFNSNNLDFVLNALKSWYGLPLVSDFSFDAVKQAAAFIFLTPLLAVYFFSQKWLVQNLESSGIVG